MLFMGGVNAVETAAALVCRWRPWSCAVCGGGCTSRAASCSGGRRPWRSAIAVVGCCRCWCWPRTRPRSTSTSRVPSNTTGLIGWSEAGAGRHPLGVVPGDRDQPWWPAAYALVIDPSGDRVSAVVAASAWSVWPGTAAACAGRWSCQRRVGLAASSRWRTGGLRGRSSRPGALQTWLDGPCRSSATCTSSTRSSGSRSRSGSGRWPSRDGGPGDRAGPTSARPRPLAVLGALVLVLPLMASRTWRQPTRTPGWTDIPRAWHQTAEYVARAPRRAVRRWWCRVPASPSRPGDGRWTSPPWRSTSPTGSP